MAAKLYQRLRVTGLVIMLVGVVACGPVEYVNQVSRKASSEVQAAKAVQADKHAPYYYTLAVEYLHKAREEAAHSDFQAANRFGKRAEQAARKARTEALEQAQKPTPKVAPHLEADDEDLEFVDPGESEDAEHDDADDGELDNPLKDER